MRDKNLVAVYGSLLKGLGNHGVMQHAQGDLIASGTISDFGLYPYCRTAYPCIAELEDGIVHVEVYEVNDSGLRVLDMLEGYPDFYNRKKVNVTANKVYTDVWVYYHEELDQDLELIPHGDWKKYKEEVVNDHY